MLKITHKSSFNIYRIIIVARITTDNTVSGIKSDFSGKIMYNVLLGISGVFLVITIIFGIIFAKSQQKRHHKSSK